MAKKPATVALPADGEQPPKPKRGRPKIDRGAIGANCTDETRRTVYREALILMIAFESAKEVANSKQGRYRAYLKESAKLGVSIESVTNAIAHRMDDAELLVVAERERLKMLELSGSHPNLFAKIADRYDVQEPTHNEEEENHILIAYDRGVLAGRKGHERDGNPYTPGTLGHVKWIAGYNSGQRIIADEMAMNVDEDLSSTRSTPRPPPHVVVSNDDPDDDGQPVSQSAKAAAIAASLSDERMPGDMPGIVH